MSKKDMQKEVLLFDSTLLCERIEDLRKGDGKKKYTLEELSKQIEFKTGVSISPQQLGKYENADLQQRININNLMAIANFYDVSLDFLLGKTNSKRRNYTDQMTSNKFGLSDKSMKQLSLIANNKSLNNNEFKLMLINYIIENNNFLVRLTENMLDFYKASDYKSNRDKQKEKEFKMFKYELHETFTKFLDNSYEELWKNKRIKKTYLFNVPKQKKGGKK